ncbi:MAG: bilirubin utilization transcriptional regulator BilQ [Oscillospiraceae bacterium]
MFQTLAYFATVFYRDFTAYTTGRLHKLGLSFGLLFPLTYVGKHPGCTQGELTSALGLDWGYSQRSIARLVEDGFLTREKSGRAYRLNLSEKGQDAFGLSHQVFYDWDQERLSALEPAERERLIALLAKVKRQDKER